MDLSEEKTSILYKNTIRYLSEIAKKVPNTLNVLKSYYASKFHISEIQTKIILEKNKNKADERCPKCCLKLRQTESSYVVKSGPRKSTFAKKLLKKVEERKDLTKFQEKYLKKNESKLKPGNQLVVTCGFCRKDVIYDFKKPKKVVNKKVNTPQNKKKTKRKKDKFCGLRQDAVNSIKVPFKEVGQIKNTQTSNKTGQNNKTQINNNNKLQNMNKKSKKVHKNILKKEKKNLKKNLSKLSNMLKETNLNPKKNNLAEFLQSLSK